MRYFLQHHSALFALVTELQTVIITVINFIPTGGPIMFFGALNSFVHTIMYSYYLLSALPVKLNFIHYLKKPVTQLQIVSNFYIWVK